MIYALGAVKPQVKKAAEEVGNKFGVTTIYGVGARETANSDHPKGLALDFMVGTDATKGDQIAAFLQQNQGAYGVSYIIWKQRIWNVARASEGWRSMADRGSITANHFDHVHVSFLAKGGNGNIVSNIGNAIPNPIGGVTDSVKQAKEVIDFVTNGHNWLRVGMVLLGALFVLEGVLMVAGIGSPLIKTTAKTVAKGIK